MTDSRSYLDWDSITNRFLYIVPKGSADDPHYAKQSTIELTEVAQKVCEAAGLTFEYLDSTIQAIFCWAFRNHDVLQTCQMNGVFHFENVVVLPPE